MNKVHSKVDFYECMSLLKRQLLSNLLETTGVASAFSYGSRVDFVILFLRGKDDALLAYRS